jgi:Tfp pilus assembly protein PilF
VQKEEDMFTLARQILVRLMPALLLVVSPAAMAQAGGCGNPALEGSNAQDYRTATPEARNVVERRHFTDDVRMMRRGTSTSEVAADIAYTLRKFPNHPQALMTMGDYALKVKRNPPPGAQHTVECWFERALVFVPDDAMVKTVYGLYLIKARQPKAAVAQLEAALAQAGDNANVHYNLGLAYFDLKQYDKARERAHSAYGLGFPLPGLKNKLQRVGAWRAP